MARKPHGLLLLFEGLPETVIQSQVFARIKWIQETRLATYDVLAFAHDYEQVRQSRQRATELQEVTLGTIKIVRSLRPALPISRLINRALLGRTLSTYERQHDFIHARTDYSAAVSGPLAQKLQIPMLWDCRGDAEGEFIDRERLRIRPGIALRWRARQHRMDGQIAARTCTAASFVSDALRRRWCKSLGGKPNILLGCIADPEIFFFNPKVRAAARQELGFSDVDTVFVYSGSLAHYQGFDLVVDWFHRAREQLPSARLLVATPAPGAAREALAGLPGHAVRVISVGFGDVNRILNAADIGLLLRPSLRTNTAAFPTKFAEYGLAGLPVLMNNTVPDCADIANSAGNLISADISQAIKPPSAEERLRIMGEYRRRLTHQAMADRSREMYGALGNPN